MFFVTEDDKVYGFGYNDFGCCGLGHNNYISEPQIIRELCDKMSSNSSVVYTLQWLLQVTMNFMHGEE